jgi:hypothetical protein
VRTWISSQKAGMTRTTMLFVVADVLVYTSRASLSSGRRVLIGPFLMWSVQSRPRNQLFVNKQALSITNTTTQTHHDVAYDNIA